MIIFPQKRVHDLFPIRQEIRKGKGPLANLVYIKTQDGEWYEGTPGVGGIDMDSKTWNIEVWLYRPPEFVKAIWQYTEQIQL